MDIERKPEESYLEQRRLHFIPGKASADEPAPYISLTTKGTPFEPPITASIGAYLCVGPDETVRPNSQSPELLADMVEQALEKARRYEGRTFDPQPLQAVKVFVEDIDRWQPTVDELRDRYPPRI